jgi:hypothetical protein
VIDGNFVVDTGVPAEIIVDVTEVLVGVTTAATEVGVVSMQPRPAALLELTILAMPDWAAVQRLYCKFTTTTVIRKSAVSKISASNGNDKGFTYVVDRDIENSSSFPTGKPSAPHIGHTTQQDLCNSQCPWQNMRNRPGRESLAG